MKKLLYVFFAMLVTCGFAQLAVAAPTAAGKAEAKNVEQKSAFQPFSVYSDQGAKGNHYAASGWMGDYGDLKINPGDKESPRSGATSFKITYSGKMTQNAGWAGIYWQQPANNWGERKGGYNIAGASKLTFWARGAKGGETVADFKMGGITGEYADTDSQSTGPIVLTREWKQYSIDLKDKDLSNIIGGFCFTASKDDNPDGFVFYLDDIVYE